MEIYADIFIRPAVSRSYAASPPGYRVDFRGGQARIVDLRTLAWAFQRPDITISPVARYLGHVPMWLTAMTQKGQQMRARLDLGNGEVVGPDVYMAPDWAPPLLSDPPPPVEEPPTEEPPIWPPEGWVPPAATAEDGDEESDDPLMPSASQRRSRHGADS